MSATAIEPNKSSRVRSRAPSGGSFWIVVTLISIIGLSLLLILPIVRLVFSSFSSADGQFVGREAMFAPYVTFFTEPYYYQTLINSFQVAVLATIFAVIVGTTTAYLTTRYNLIGKNLIRTMVIVTFVSPPFIGAYAWILVAGRSGIVTTWLASMGFPELSIYGWRGIVLVFTLQFFPFVFLMVSSGLKTIDQSIEDAALNLGKSPTRAFWTALLPCMIPSITTGALLAFLAAFADFGTPMIVGERFRMLATQIYTQFASEFGGNHAMASSLASILLVITIGALLVQRMIARRHSYGGQTLRPLAVRRVTGMRRVLLSAAVWIPVGMAMIPMITIVISSFLATDIGGLRLLPQFSLDSYRTVFRTNVAMIAMRNSIVFTGAATLIGVVAGALMAYVVVRRPSRATRFLDTMTMIPYSIAGVVLGISMSMTFGPPPFLLAGTSVIIIMAYFVRRLPFSVRSVVSMLQQTGTEIEEASINLGIPPGKTFIRVTAPAVASGILSGALLTWATTVRELNATMILYVGRTTTMPVQVFVEVLQGQFGRASALGTVLILFTFIPIVILFKFLGKDEDFLV